MKRKLLKSILIGIGLSSVLAIQPAVAKGSCQLRSNHGVSSSYITVKGGRHHRRGDNHHNRGSHRSSRHHRSSNHHNNSYNADRRTHRSHENHHRRHEFHHSRSY